MDDPAVGRAIGAVMKALDGSGSRAVAAHLDEDTLLHMPGGSGLAGDYQGREAICGLLERLTEASHGTVRFEAISSSLGPARGVRVQGKVSGERLERALAMTATLETIVVNEVIREAWLTCSDQTAWDTFWS